MRPTRPAGYDATFTQTLSPSDPQATHRHSRGAHAHTQDTHAHAHTQPFLPPPASHPRRIRVQSSAIGCAAWLLAAAAWLLAAAAAGAAARGASAKEE